MRNLLVDYHFDYSILILGHIQNKHFTIIRCGINSAPYDGTQIVLNIELSIHHLNVTQLICNFNLSVLCVAVATT